MGAHVRAAEQGRGVDAELAETAARSHVEHGDGDLGEVVVEGHVHLAAGGGVGVRQLPVGLVGGRGGLEVEEVRLVRVEQPGGDPVGVEGAAREVVEGHRLQAAEQPEGGLAHEQPRLAVIESGSYGGRAVGVRHRRVADRLDQRSGGGRVVTGRDRGLGPLGPLAGLRLEIGHVGLQIDVHRDEALNLAQARRDLGLAVQVGVADLAAAAPAEEEDLAEAAAGDGAGEAGHADGEAEVAGVLLQPPILHEREVGHAGRHEGPAIVDPPDVEAVLGEEDRDGMGAGEERGAEIPDVSWSEEDRARGVGRHVRRGLFDHAMEADLIVGAGADPDGEEVLGHAVREDAALDVREGVGRGGGRGLGRSGLGKGEGGQRQGGGQDQQGDFLPERERHP